MPETSLDIQLKSSQLDDLINGDPVIVNDDIRILPPMEEVYVTIVFKVPHGENTKTASASIKRNMSDSLDNCPYEYEINVEE